MVCWKVFVNEVQEFAGYVRFRVEPNYISPSSPGGWWASSGVGFEFDFFSVPAGYPLDKAAYDKLYMENVTKSYKRAGSNVYHDINLEAKEIATELKIADIVERMAKKEAFITLKDHKDDFIINPKYRLVNPAKSELGKVSKTIIENINNKVKEQTRFNQWKKTDDVIRWFSNIRDKANCVFIQFDIQEFYPSISKDLLQKSLEYAKQFTNIPPEDIFTLMHARCSALLTTSPRRHIFYGSDWSKIHTKIIKLRNIMIKNNFPSNFIDRCCIKLFF